MRNELNKHLGGLCDKHTQTHWTAKYNEFGSYVTRKQP